MSIYRFLTEHTNDFFRCFFCLINFLIDNDLLGLLDEKTQVVANYRIKYPESSYQELAQIISVETDYKIGKSGINHNFRKIRELINRYKESGMNDNK